MASRRFTVDSVKKNKFFDIFLLMPETGAADAMRSAKFTEEDIADLQMWHFLQRALPGGSIKGLKAYVATTPPSLSILRPPSSTLSVPPLSLSMPLSTSS
jgi:hypothetical protein